MSIAELPNITYGRPHESVDGLLGNASIFVYALLDLQYYLSLQPPTTLHVAAFQSF